LYATHNVVCQRDPKSNSRVNTVFSLNETRTRFRKRSGHATQRARVNMFLPVRCGQFRTRLDTVSVRDRVIFRPLSLFPSFRKTVLAVVICEWLERGEKRFRDGKTDARRISKNKIKIYILRSLCVTRMYNIF